VKLKTNHRLLRSAAFFGLCACAVFSLFFTVRAGSRNGSFILPLIFAAWVLSPFAALLVAYRKSAGWPVGMAARFYILMLGIAVVSLIIYSGFVHLPGTKPAFVFLITPLISWLVIAVMLVQARNWPRKN